MEHRFCEVCGVAEEEAAEVFGVGLIMSERMALLTCAECLRCNDPDCADRELGSEDET